MTQIKVKACHANGDEIVLFILKRFEMEMNRWRKELNMRHSIGPRTTTQPLKMYLLADKVWTEWEPQDWQTVEREIHSNQRSSVRKGKDCSKISYQELNCLLSISVMSYYFQFYSIFFSSESPFASKIF